MNDNSKTQRPLHGTCKLSNACKPADASQPISCKLTALEAEECLQRIANARKAAHLRRFYRTAPGTYGASDRFLGLTVPQVRAFAKIFQDLNLSEVEKLLQSPWHEVRLLAGIIMSLQFAKAQEKERAPIIALYVRRAECFSNWDLVDLTCNILGTWLLDKERSVLYDLAQSPCLWRRRIAIVCTKVFIAKSDFADTLALSDLLLDDSEDLMHKAVGWMLREVGKRDEGVLREFLMSHYQRLHRTTLRYAIEKFPPEERLAWLKGPAFAERY